MASLETVALDQERWGLTANRLKNNESMARSLVSGLSIAGAILAVLAVQIRTSHPAASEVVGYAGAVALTLVLVVRAQALRRGRVQAWVLAAAASQSLQSEMCLYRTSSGPYGDHFGGNPEATLLERRDEILEKVRSIQKYAVEPDPKTVVLLGPMDADAYISERVNPAISENRRFGDYIVEEQRFWQKAEYILVIVGALLAAALTFTHNLAPGAWVAVITTMCVAVGADTQAERFAELTVSYRAMPDRLTNIVSRWRTNHGTVNQLVEQVEAMLLQEYHAWVAGADEYWKDAA